MKKLITLLSVAVYFNINAQIITTVAGDSTGGYSGDGGLAIMEQLNNPFGVATDQYRNIYIADMNNSRVRKVIASTGIISTVAGTGTYGYNGDAGAAVNATLSSPYGVALDASGNIYIADYDNYVVRKVTVATGNISTFAGNGTGGYSGDNGSSLSAQLGGPMGVAADAFGNIYIADYNNNCIRLVTGSTGNITTVAGNGTQGYNGDNGAAVNAQLNHPTGVSVDASGNLYIADYGNNVVRMVNPSGTITTFAGNGSPGYSGDNGAAVNAQLNHPRNITASSTNLYIADYANQVIRKVNSSGIISTIVGNGTQGYKGDCGKPTSAELAYPAGMAIDSYGNLYIADNINNRIRKVGFNATATHIAAHTTHSVVCSGNSVTFTGSGASTYTWTNGVVNGTPYTTPVETAATSINYTVTGTDTIGCVGSATISITVNPLPTVSAASATICAGQSVTLTGIGALTYTWTGGITNGVPFMPGATSSYMVTGSNTYSCTSTATATVTVISTSNPLPTITISSSPITSCGGSGTLTASGASTYTWNTGSSNASIVVTPTISTTYSVIGTSQGCKASSSIIQIVNIVNVTSSMDSLCSGSTAVLTANPTNALNANQTITYTWTSGQDSSSIHISPTTTLNDTVMGRITTIATNNDTTTCNYITVFTQMVRTLNVSTNTDSLCLGNSAMLSVNGASTYTWTPGNQNGSVVAVSPTVTTIYTVTGTAQTCTVTNTINQVVKSPVIITVNSNIDTICVGGTATLTANGANTYIWSTTQTGNSIVVTPTVTTRYIINGTKNGCSDTSSFIQNVNNTCFAGIKNASEVTEEITIYPNPAINNSFVVSMDSNNNTETKIIILNALGQNVFETKSSGQSTQVNLPNCLAGVYYVQINNGSNRVGAKKVIIQ